MLQSWRFYGWAGMEREAEVGKCKWMPPKNYWWQGNLKCTREAEEGHDFCLFHLGLEEKRKDQELTERFKIEFKKLYEAGDWDFRGFVFPDKMEFRELDFQNENQAEERNQKESVEIKEVIFRFASFGDEVKFGKVTFGLNAIFSRRRIWK